MNPDSLFKRLLHRLGIAAVEPPPTEEPKPVVPLDHDLGSDPFLSITTRSGENKALSKSMSVQEISLDVGSVFYHAVSDRVVEIIKVEQNRVTFQAMYPCEEEQELDMEVFLKVYKFHS